MNRLKQDSFLRPRFLIPKEATEKTGDLGRDHLPPKVTEIH